KCSAVTVAERAVARGSDQQQDVSVIWRGLASYGR
ncbi:hypothetical protein L195_g063420, partial [Trifolium pratense]